MPSAAIRPCLLPPDGLTADLAAALSTDSAPPPALAQALAAILTRLSQARTQPDRAACDTLSADRLPICPPPKP